MVIVLLIGGAAASYQISNTPGLWQPVTSHNPDSDKKSSSSDGTDSGSHQSSAFSPSKSSSQQSSGTGSDNVKISSSEAESNCSTINRRKEQLQELQPLLIPMVKDLCGANYDEWESGW